jgi:uncharacterized protein YuzE
MHFQIEASSPERVNLMVFQYFPDTDMLYIQLVSAVSVESEEVAPNIVLDFDHNNHVIGIEIEDASKLIDLSKLEVSAFPLSNLMLKRDVSIALAA